MKTTTLRSYTACRMLGALALLLACCEPATAQVDIVGDGFGGRSWYKPGNLEAGWTAAGTVLNRQLYLWGSNVGNSYGPLIKPFTSVDQYGTPAAGGDYVHPYDVAGFSSVKMLSLSGQGGTIKTDGSGWVWGRKGYIPSASSSDIAFGNTPINVIASGTCHVSAGMSHVAFAKTDGTIWSVNYNRYGNFGNGTTSPTTSFSAAVQMTGITNAKRVIAFGSALDNSAVNILSPSGMMVLKENGTVWVTGAGGVLVSNSTNNTATQVPCLTNVVARGQYHAMALTASGDVYA